MASIRVLVIDDSLTVRKHLAQVLGEDPELEVVGEAGSGMEAIALCQRLRPDVLTLDLVMPGLSGVQTTEHIMAYMPTPILIVSSSQNRGEIDQTYEALAAGAVDAIDKLGDMGALWAKAFIAKVKLVSRIRVITHPRAKLAPARLPARTALPAVPRTGSYELVAIGASTGGPAAVVKILSALPADFPLPLLLVIHLGEPFGRTFADWLDRLSPIPVVQATDGEPLPRPGTSRVIMAPPGCHLELLDGRLWLTQGPERFSCRPSVDVLFESIAREIGVGAIACLLTGMGRDGAAGLLALKQAGATTIAQDEATSAVYGMPREAVQLAAARHVLPLDQIAGTLRELADRRKP